LTTHILAVYNTCKKSVYIWITQKEPLTLGVMRLIVIKKIFYQLPLSYLGKNGESKPLDIIEMQPTPTKVKISGQEVKNSILKFY
jgi:hypothetical protein